MATTETFLITGAFGSIGAWACRQLVEEGARVVAYDLPGRPHRLELVMTPEQLARVTILAGDVTDQDGLDRAVVGHGVTHLIHLAALVHPFVVANPIRGANVNVVGHAIAFESARRHAGQVNGVVYASSVAVYGPAALYPPGRLAADAALAPASLYGVTKRANEEWARVCWEEQGVRSVGLRPFFVYGPARDQGVSSTPTKAMVAAAVGKPYHVPFGGKAMYQHAQDAAAAFIAASRAMPPGAPVRNLGGEMVAMAGIVAVIEAEAPEMAGRITHAAEPLFFPEGLHHADLEEVTGPVRFRPMAQGIRDTMAFVREAVADGRMDVDRALA